MTLCSWQDVNYQLLWLAIHLRNSIIHDDTLNCSDSVHFLQGSGIGIRDKSTPPPNQKTTTKTPLPPPPTNKHKTTKKTVKINLGDDCLPYPTNRFCCCSQNIQRLVLLNLYLEHCIHDGVMITWILKNIFVSIKILKIQNNLPHFVQKRFELKWHINSDWHAITVQALKQNTQEHLKPWNRIRNNISNPETEYTTTFQAMK